MQGPRLPLWARIPLALGLYTGLSLLVSLALLVPTGGEIGPRTIAWFAWGAAGAGFLTVAILLGGIAPGAWRTVWGGGGARAAIRGMGVGLLLGGGVASILTGVILAGGFVRDWSLGGARPGPSASLGAALFAAALAEELFFRGFVHTRLRERLGPVGSATVGGGLFSLVHFMNPGASLLPALNVFLAGFLLALLRERTGGLAWPVGVHAGWNLTLGMVYGLPVSGVDLPSVFRIDLESPRWLGGGSFGPEGSVVCTGLLLLPLLVFMRVRLERPRPDREQDTRP
jgi:membrane protease YdiL (CAAX protease family)